MLASSLPITVVGLLVGLFIFLPSTAMAGSVKLAWDRNPEPHVTYVVAYGTQPGSPTSRLSVGPRVAVTINNLVDGERYYFVVHAYRAGALSEPSNEVSAVAQSRPGGLRQPSNSRSPAGQSGGSSSDKKSSLAAQSSSRGSGGTTMPAAGDMEVVPTDVVVPGDYDGDGIGDLAIWRPAAGTWNVLPSSSGSLEVALGAPGDVPVPGDYDGDGRTDIAVWRPSDGTWGIRSSSTTYADAVFMRWGIEGDVPVSADLDGDGKAELIVYRPSTGEWFVRYSSQGYEAGSLGVLRLPWQ